MSRKQQILGLIGWLLVSFAAGAVGGIASANAGTFYQQLVRPNWSPPGWLFAPVWSLLYLMLGIAVWLVWRERSVRENRFPLALFLIQLIANGLWTWLFFVWRQGMIAFGEILLLWGLILATIVTFWRVKPIAGALLVPYLLWVSFATALTYAVWQLNPQLLR